VKVVSICDRFHSATILFYFVPIFSRIAEMDSGGGIYTDVRMDDQVSVEDCFCVWLLLLFVHFRA